jgi:hypothetical protein
MLRALFGIGTARSLQGANGISGSLCFVWMELKSALLRLLGPISPLGGYRTITVPRLTLAA